MSEVVKNTTSESTQIPHISHNGTDVISHIATIVNLLLMKKQNTILLFQITTSEQTRNHVYTQIVTSHPTKILRIHTHLILTSAINKHNICYRVSLHGTYLCE